jgi:cytochrome c oxidase assembly protein subunit 15
VTGVVGLPCIAAFLLAYKREPRRRDLTMLSAFLPLGVLAQAILGGLTVIFELKPGFVMAHFLLSMVILAAAVALYWRARHEPGERRAEDGRVTLATRALLPLGALAIFAGTFATAAGPHPGHNEGEEPIGRFDGLGVNTLDTLIHWHGRSGTLLGLAALTAWFLARRHGAGTALRNALTAVCLLVAAQGVIGFAQYELQLPAGLVWLHVLVAAGTWLAICFANAAAPRAVPAPAVPPPRVTTAPGEPEPRTLVETP